MLTVAIADAILSKNPTWHRSERSGSAIPMQDTAAVLSNIDP